MIFLAIILLVLFIKSYKSDTFVFSIDKTNILKATLPILIIIGHCALNFDILKDFQKTGAIAVSLFFFISGYGLELKRLKHEINLKYFIKRITSIIIPIIIPSVIYISALYIKGYNIFEIVLENIQRWNIILPFTWFVTKLIIIYTLFYVSTIAKKYNTLIFISLLILFDLSCIFLKSPSHTYISDSGFIFGILFTRLKFLNNIKLRNVIIILHFILLFILIPYTNKGIIFIYTILLFTILSTIIISSTSTYKLRTLQFIKEISYELYLCQGIAFLPPPLTNINKYLLSLVILITTFIIAYIVKKISNFFNI